MMATHRQDVQLLFSKKKRRRRKMSSKQLVLNLIFKLITFATDHNNIDIGNCFQFFPEFRNKHIQAASHNHTLIFPNLFLQPTPGYRPFRQM